MRGKFDDETLLDTVRQALLEQGAIVPHVEVQRVAAIPKTAAGKAPLITSKLSTSSPLSGVLDSEVSMREAINTADTRRGAERHRLASATLLRYCPLGLSLYFSYPA